MTERCPNCGSEQVESYCASCGQHSRDLHTPVSAFVREALDEVYSLDSRVWRTLVALVRHPGSLTVDYWRGRRAQFVRPLRLYLLVSFVTFLFFVVATPGSVVDVTGENPSAPVRFGSGPLPDDLRIGDVASVAEAPDIPGGIAQDADPARPDEDSSERPGWFERRVLQPALEDPERTQALFIERLQWMVFALVPLFAVWLRLLYRRRERFFVPHLVFALHFHALSFLLLVAGTAGTLILGIRIVSAIAYLAVVVMLFLSLRRVYAEGIVKTVAKQVALLFAHLVAVNLGLMALFIFTGLTA